MTISYTPARSVMGFVASIEQIAVQLKNLQSPVSDIQIMAKILMSLPPSFRHFVSAWDSVPEAEKTISLLTSRLVKEEKMTKMYNNGAADPSDVAYFSGNMSTTMPFAATQQNLVQPTIATPAVNYHQESYRGRGGYHRSGGRYGRGGSRGGYRGSHTTREPYQVTCFWCRRPGHKATNCRDKIKTEQQQSRSQDNRDFSYTSSICFTARR